MEASQVISFIEVLAIILSIVALLVTVMGFFASLKFYRDGMMLQSRASDALVRIEEKAASIHTQVGGMFDKTLEAAIGRKQLDQNFEEVNEQLEETAKKIVESALGQIGDAGEAQRKRLEEMIEAQLEALRGQIERTRESAEELVGGPAEPGPDGPGAEIPW